MPGRRCDHEGCKIKNAKFGTPGKIEDGRYCSRHKKTGMVNLYAKLCKCKPPKVKKTVNYAKPGKPATHCADCKTDDMINVNSKNKCIICKERIPSFGKPETKKATHCGICIKKNKIKGLVDVTHKKCQCPKNPKTAYFNYEGMPAKYCNNCKEPGMINVRNKRCIGCKGKRKIRAGYGKLGGKAEYCFKHKKKGMVDLFSRRCAYKGCDILQPKFNDPKKLSGIYCFKHKKKGMINVCANYCKEEDCNLQASFNNEGEKKGLYCVEHMKDGMINVTHNRCEFNGCEIQPGFNKPGKKGGKFCSKHKEDGMVNVIHVMCHCGKYAHFNEPGSTKGKYCTKHKKNGMVVIGNKMCINQCGAQQHNSLYEGHCYQCFVELFPDNPISISYLVKEKYVRNFIMEVLKKYEKKISDIREIREILYNKIITGGSSKRRPDIYIRFDEYAIIIEVDEHMHSIYDGDDDIIRLEQLYDDIKVPIVFIRFNPDTYCDKNHKKIPSPWKKTFKGTVLNSDLETEWKKRLKKLYNCFSHWISHVPKNTITIEYLYYNYDHEKNIVYDW